MILKLLFAAAHFPTPLLAQHFCSRTRHLATGSLTAPTPWLNRTLRAGPKAEPGIRQTAYPLRVATTPRCRAPTAAAAYQVQRLTDQP